MTTAYGTNGLTDDHWEAFRRHGTERVLIAFDRDEAGERAAASVAEKLTAAGIEAFRVHFPKGMDANEYACKVKPATKSLEGGRREAHSTIVTEPGEEGQVDYGDGPMVRDPKTGRYRRTRLFVLTLGYSRRSVWLLTSAAPRHARALRRDRAARARPPSRSQGQGGAGGRSRRGGAAQEVIDWVMRAEGVSFRHAVEPLREGLPSLSRSVDIVAGEDLDGAEAAWPRLRRHRRSRAARARGGLLELGPRRVLTL